MMVDSSLNGYFLESSMLNTTLNGLRGLSSLTAQMEGVFFADPRVLAFPSTVARTYPLLNLISSSSLILFICWFNSTKRELSESFPPVIRVSSPNPICPLTLFLISSISSFNLISFSFFHSFLLTSLSLHLNSFFSCSTLSLSNSTISSLFSNLLFSSSIASISISFLLILQLIYSCILCCSSIPIILQLFPIIYLSTFPQCLDFISEISLSLSGTRACLLALQSTSSAS